LSLFEVVGLTAFILIIFLGLFSTLFGFPGTVVILLTAIVYSCVTGFSAIGIYALISLIVISALAESLGFYLVVIGAKRFELSKQTLITAILGGLFGAFLMTPVLMGLGTLAGGLLGSFSGLAILQFIEEKSLKPCARANPKAMLGGLTGTFVKGFCALVMVIIVLSAIYS
jgi:hypothetical protein